MWRQLEEMLADSVFKVGLKNPSAHVSLLDMTIENGIAQKGGGIYNKGTLHLMAH